MCIRDRHWINGHPTPIANPMSAYPRYQQYRKSWGINALGSVIVEIEAEDGTTGVGEFNRRARVVRVVTIKGTCKVRFGK